jgi:hypothetical protein
VHFVNNLVIFTSSTTWQYALRKQPGDMHFINNLAICTSSTTWQYALRQQPGDMHFVNNLANIHFINNLVNLAGNLSDLLQLHYITHQPVLSL